MIARSMAGCIDRTNSDGGVMSPETFRRTISGSVSGVTAHRPVNSS